MIHATFLETALPNKKSRTQYILSTEFMYLAGCPTITPLAVFKFVFPYASILIVPSPSLPITLMTRDYIVPVTLTHLL